MALTRTLATVISSALFLVLACGRITGIDDYALVDCPTDTCGDGGEGGASTEGGAGDATSNPARDGATSEAAGPTCPVGTALVTVHNNSGSHITSNPPGIDAVFGQTDSACFQVGQNIRLETNDGELTWSGVNCSRNSRCEFDVGPTGATITVTP